MWPLKLFTCKRGQYLVFHISDTTFLPLYMRTCTHSQSELRFFQAQAGVRLAEFEVVRPVFSLKRQTFYGDCCCFPSGFMLSAGIREKEKHRMTDTYARTYKRVAMMNTKFKLPNQALRSRAGWVVASVTQIFFPKFCN